VGVPGASKALTGTRPDGTAAATRPPWTPSESPSSPSESPSSPRRGGSEGVPGAEEDGGGVTLELLRTKGNERDGMRTGEPERDSMVGGRSKGVSGLSERRERQHGAGRE
jgi:hypothetical protein